MIRRNFLATILLVIMLCTGLLCISPLNNDDVYSMAQIDDDVSLSENNHDEVALYNSHDKYVYLGGIPLGIDVKSYGLVIMKKQEVITDNGSECPFEDIDIKNGDRLVAIDDIEVDCKSDITKSLSGKEMVNVTISHNGICKTYTIKPSIDALTHQNRLGLWLRDGITGIGTLTYIDGATRRYGALGHPIEEGENYRSGNIYNAEITGYISGSRGKPGELNGNIMGYKAIGTLEKNTNFGVFGTFTSDISSFKRIEVANRKEVKPGKATIFTTINGTTPEEYDIEIIKRNYQSSPDTRGMVIRITDDRLLKTTNGIVQGMSGSPIVQNGKLIGAVTHVFINDPTKGYGIYTDFMIGN